MKIAYAEIKSKENQKIVDNLQKRLHYLYYEFYDPKCLAGDEEKKNLSSISVDTNCIIDIQNELKTTKNKIQFLRNKICRCKHQICELRIQLTSTGQKMKQSEKDKVQLQNLCARAEIASLKN